MASVFLALAIAAPAWAGSLAATSTLAPIGTGSYLLTVTNTGSEPITEFVGTVGEEPAATNIVPTACQYGNTPVVGSIRCMITVAPGASVQMCYTGHPIEEAVPGDWLLISGGGSGFATLVMSPSVPSCPLPGFKAGSSGAGGGAKCVVPNLKGKKLAAAEKAITQAGCGVGKVKKSSSGKVKKGSVISQSPAAGKPLPKGAKVSLVVSKGK